MFVLATLCVAYVSYDTKEFPMCKLTFQHESACALTGEVTETTVKSSGEAADDIFSLLKAFKRFTVAMGYQPDLWIFTVHGEFMPPPEAQLQLQQA